GRQDRAAAGDRRRPRPGPQNPRAALLLSPARVLLASSEAAHRVWAACGKAAPPMAKRLRNSPSQLRKTAAGGVFLRSIPSLSTSHPEPAPENKICQVSNLNRFSGFPRPLLLTTAMLYSTSI